MKTDTSDADVVDTVEPIPASAAFELLTSRRRRDALYYLSRRVGTVTLEELTDRVARREGDASVEGRERVSAGLHHNHLPKLAEAGVVRYDPAARTVARTSTADALDPYLDLAMREDVHV